MELENFLHSLRDTTAQVSLVIYEELKVHHSNNLKYEADQPRQQEVWVLKELVLRAMMLSGQCVQQSLQVEAQDVCSGSFSFNFEP